MPEQRYGVDIYTKTYGRDRVFTSLSDRYGDRYLKYRDAWRKAGPDWHPDFPLNIIFDLVCLLYTSPSPRDGLLSRMPSSA